MVSIEELQEEVALLEKNLKDEIEKRALVETEFSDVSDELADLKKKISNVGNRKAKQAKLVFCTPLESEKEKKSIDTPNDRVISGFLEKKASVHHSWSKKWFVLDKESSRLLYFKQKEDKNPARIIPLRGSICYAYVEWKGKRMSLFFNIRTKERDFLLRAENKEMKMFWVTNIKAAIGGSKNSTKQ